MPGADSVLRCLSSPTSYSRIMKLGLVLFFGRKKRNLAVQFLGGKLPVLFSHPIIVFFQGPWSIAENP